MRPRGGGRGEHLLAVLARLHGALLVLYPEAFRRRYSEEMRRDFRELMREGLEEGGAKELVRVLVQAHSDLVLTALKERSTTPARRYASYSSVEPRIAARAAARATVAVVLVAVGVSWASLLQTPTYEASALVLVAQGTGNGKIQLIPNAPAPETLLTLTQTMTDDTDSRPVAEETIRRLGLRMDPAELLDNLTIEHDAAPNFMALTYESTDSVEATKIVNTVGEVSSERISPISAAGSKFTATVWEKAAVPDSPVSPDPLRNGVLTLVMGLVLCVGVVVALPGVAASVASKLGRPAISQGACQAVIPFGRHGGPSVAEVLKEKELLQALVRRGKLTAVEAALETSLSVEEANRMLQALALQGQLEVTVEHGKLLYSFWGEHGA